MNNYEREKNTSKWLIGVIVLILIGTAFLVAQAVIVISNEKEKEVYQSGYKDAKLIYECDHDRAECEIIKDSIDAN